MKCLCVRQPWAELIRRGEKTIELRTWLTHYRGPLLVVSAQRRSPDHPEIDGERGALICWVELVDVRPATAEDAARALAPVDVGRMYAWEFRGARDLPPLPMKGQLSLWTPDEFVRHVVRKALAA